MTKVLTDEQKARNSAYNKEWKLKNKEKVKAYKKEYYKKNRDKIIKQQIDSINRNPERRKKTSEYWRQYTRENFEARLLAAVKHRAKKKGLEFNLTIDDIVIPNFCPKTGIPLLIHNNSENSKQKYIDTPSVDRINPNLGYVKDNIQIVCYWYNIAKLTFSDEEMLNMCKRVTEHG